MIMIPIGGGEYMGWGVKILNHCNENLGFTDLVESPNWKFPTAKKRTRDAIAGMNLIIMISQRGGIWEGVERA